MLTISNKLGIFCVYFPPSDCAGARVVRVFGFGVPALGDWCPRHRGTVHATLRGKPPNSTQLRDVQGCLSVIQNGDSVV